MNSTISRSWAKNSGRLMALFSALVIGGCATEAAKKSETVARVSEAAAPASPRPGAGKSEVSSRAAAGSSLDALREGKTPASGPLKEIHFDFDKYDLSSEARSILKANADWLRANPSANVEIEGHCDERGTVQSSVGRQARA